MTYLLLIWEFFKTGLFSIGGGLATLPYLYQMSANHPGWFTTAELSNMVAISESTPGPIGVNMASYVGFTVGNSFGGIASGILGAIVATTALVLPSVIIITLIAKFLISFKDNKTVSAVLYGIRPAAFAFIAVIAIRLFMENVFAINGTTNYSIVMFAMLFILCRLEYIKNLHPIVIILVSAAITVLLP